MNGEAMNASVARYFALGMFTLGIIVGYVMATFSYHPVPIAWSNAQICGILFNAGYDCPVKPK